MRSEGMLHIKSVMDDNYASISFTHAGGGIAREDVGRIFDPYFTPKKSGSGLGLLIVRRIVREHGGEINIESNEGRGVTLTILLPYRDRRGGVLESGSRKT